MSNKATILIVEDDINLLQGFREILELQDYNVLAASNGRAGLTIMQNCEEPPDLIVSDIMMPIMNGYEFFDAVHTESRWAAIPFIFLTARSDKSDIRLGRSMGVDDYLTKPFNAEDLLDILESRLKRRRELEQIHNAEVSDVKRNILTILNHEFRTPLTLIVAYADLLKERDGLTYQDISTFLNSMNVGAERLRHLVENFMLLVELETGEGERNFEWRRKRITDPMEILAEAASQYEALAGEKHVRLQVEPLPDSFPIVIADSEYMKIAVGRLIDNAIKFSDKPDSAIWIAAYGDGDNLCLSVEDHGRGIASNQLEAIFEMFYQVDRVTFEDQGAGIGLPIVKRIVELHGGSVHVESVFGTGSRFVIKLPKIATQA
jgi:two-component system sensor histidine kinase/response regulator